MRQADEVSADPGRTQIEAADQIPGWSGAQTGWSGARPGRSVLAGWRRELLPLIGLLVFGVLLAVVWRLLAPHTAKLGDEQEANAAVDGTLVLLGLVAGGLTAAVALYWPGPDPLARIVTAIIGSLLGAVISWQLGDLLGTPHLRAIGAAFVWPMATAAVLFIGAALPVTSARLQPAEPPAPVPPALPQPLSPYHPGDYRH
jgi:hypothetical protein